MVDSPSQIVGDQSASDVNLSFGGQDMDNNRMADEPKTVCFCFMCAALALTICIVSYNCRTTVTERAHIEAGEELRSEIGQSQMTWKKRGQP